MKKAAGQAESVDISRLGIMNGCRAWKRAWHGMAVLG
jgi:hypothetical protein